MTAPAATAHELLTVPEAAALLRTTPKGIYAMVERAQLPGVLRLGRRVLIDRQALLSSLRVSSAPSATKG